MGGCGHAIFEDARERAVNAKASPIALTEFSSISYDIQACRQGAAAPREEPTCRRKRDRIEAPI